MKCVCLLLTARLDEFHGFSSVYSGSSYQLLGWTRFIGTMCVCAQQINGLGHKSDLEQSQSLHVFLSCSIMRLAMCWFCINRSVGLVLLLLSSICSKLVSTARLDEFRWPDACVFVFSIFSMLVSTARLDETPLSDVCMWASKSLMGA